MTNSRRSAHPFLESLVQPAPHHLQAAPAGSDSELPSVYAVTDLAVDTLTAAALMAHSLRLLHAEANGEPTPPPAPAPVDRRLASLWFGFTLAPQGWEIADAWDEVAGVYPCVDGFVRLHTNAPHHRRAAISVLDCADQRAAVTAAVAQCNGVELQEAIYAQGGVAVALNTRQQWSEHPHGAMLADEPLVHHQRSEPASPVPDRPSSPNTPLAGVRVLDLTRVLAGPVATRFLAGLGADVVRVDPPDWDEPGVIPEVTLGKRCTRMDLTDPETRERFTELLATADLLLHGYRPGALDGLGFTPDERRRINPGLVDVSLNAWGHSGPWADRRGFDSIVQIANGIAAAGMEAYGEATPRPLPVQALDHAAGYTLATCALRGWHDRLTTGAGSTWRTSLAAHGELLANGPAGPLTAEFPPLAEPDLSPDVEQTGWGPGRRARFPLTGLVNWSSGAAKLGSTEQATWRI